MIADRPFHWSDNCRIFAGDDAAASVRVGRSHLLTKRFATLTNYLAILDFGKPWLWDWHVTFSSRPPCHAVPRRGDPPATWFA